MEESVSNDLALSVDSARERVYRVWAVEYGKGSLGSGTGVGRARREFVDEAVVVAVLGGKVADDGPDGGLDAGRAGNERVRHREGAEYAQRPANEAGLPAAADDRAAVVDGVGDRAHRHAGNVHLGD